jgi:CHAD domain-containing protein
VPDGGEVESFVKRPDVGGPVAELTEHRTERVLVVDRERRADGDRQMAPDDAPAAQEATIDVEQVHRAAVAARHTRLLAEQLGHDGCRRAPDGERRGVVAVAHE